VFQTVRLGLLGQGFDASIFFLRCRPASLRRVSGFRFILVPLGSAGDVHPLVWLGRVLAGRGHEVCVVAQAAVAEIPQRAGLRTRAVGNAEQQLAVTRHPGIWKPWGGFRVLAGEFPGWARELMPAIEREILPDRTVLVGGGIAFAARILGEARRLPHATVQLQPAAFLSAQDPPVFVPGAERLKRCPWWLRRLCLRLSFWETDRLLRRPLNRLRREAGLTTPVRGIMRDWWMSPHLVLALFPEWFAPPQSDWARQTVMTRFPLYDECEQRALPADLEHYLNNGPPPILFTPGSANSQAARFFTVGMEACRRLGRRALLVTRFREQLPATLPAGAAHFDYLPFSAVFPRCAAVVHHGGIGTSAQGLAAGVPQLIMAMSFDQPDNGWRLRTLGVGDYLYPRRFQPGRVAETLQRLTRDDRTAAACRQAKDRLQHQMPPEQVAELLEALART
jgi:rhamnosyltransferase subunit B